MRVLALAGAVLLAAAGVQRRRSLNRVRLIVLAAVAVALAAYGAGLITTGSLDDTIREAGPTLGAWMYLVVGALAFLETAALIGLVVPGELAVVIGGVAAAQGGVDVVTVFGVAWAGAVAGDVASYGLGRRLGRGFLERHGPRVGVTPVLLGRAERIFERHGGKAILAGRFVGIVRALAPFLAGVSRMDARRFVAVDIVGAGLWAAAFTLLGHEAAAHLDTALSAAGRGKLVLLGVLAAGLLVLAVRRQAVRSRTAAETGSDAG